MEKDIHLSYFCSHNQASPVLTLYAAVRGVGGINCWGAEVEEEYRLKGEGNYHLSFRIE